MQKLSIITINLNNANGLEKTIKSVVEQNYNEFEFIIIDGGSIDTSVDVIKKYGDKISYWESEKDTGIYNAMNKGIKQAKGEYCLFLNSGDQLINKEILKKIFSKSISSDHDILFGDKMIEKNGKLEQGSYFPEKIDLPFLIKSFICHQATFIKRDLFFKCEMYDEELKIVSDWKFFLKIFIFHNIKEKNVHEVITIYDTNGISNTNTKLRDSERAEVLRTIVPPKVLDVCQRYNELSDKYRSIISLKVYKIISKFYKI